MRSYTLSIATILVACAAGETWGAEPARDRPLEVGDKAPTLELTDSAGETVDLEEVFESDPTVLVMLRGWPGYQCPLCMRQVSEYAGQAKAFRDAGARVLLVYPGPDESLADRATEFLNDQRLARSAPKARLPKPFTLLVDSEYRLTNAYGLRWDEPHETALPSTFVILPNREVVYAKVAKEHGGRAPVREVVKALAMKEAGAH